MTGTFYVIGVGPGDPELITLKAVNRLRQAQVHYVPASRLSRQSWLTEVVARYAAVGSKVREVEFSLGRDVTKRQEHWRQVAAEIIAEIRCGKRVAFVTLGDPLLYSTSIYLLRALQQQWQDPPVEIVPGISACSHVAALTEFAIGCGEQPVTILPVVMDTAALESALKRGGTLILMKIGKRLPRILALLKQFDLLEKAVFVTRAGLPQQRIETDLRRLLGADAATGNLAVILVDANRENKP